jgi:HPt (histidine-containing phosphotransfer) domain-containing protein
MTASARDADRARCLAAGMDDFVRKPISAAALAAVLSRWTRAADPVLDAAHLEELRALGAGTARVLTEVVERFLATAPRRMAEIQAAAEGGDLEEVARTAHGLKGICGTVGALRLAALCAEVEDVGRARDATRTFALLPGLEAELGIVKGALEQELATNPLGGS